LVELTRPLELAESMERKGALTELKRGPKGELIGLAIDWTEVPKLREPIVENLRRMSGEGSFVAYDERSTFVDFYAAHPDKGRALKQLKGLLGVKGNVMFIGDGPADNDAFQQAEVAVGVSRGQALDDLLCRFVVEQARLEEFLRSLSDCRMEFTASLPGVIQRDG
jgi:hydroxymethylpyrimidine pyrophosphatase-like HAD family hydrolase